MSHEYRNHIRNRCCSVPSLASAWCALCRLSASGPWLWLVRSSAFEAAPALGLVLLDGLSRILVAIGEGAPGHG
jgi:hypothetical protein